MKTFQYLLSIPALLSPALSDSAPLQVWQKADAPVALVEEINRPSPLLHHRSR